MRGNVNQILTIIQLVSNTNFYICRYISDIFDIFNSWICFKLSLIKLAYLIKGGGSIDLLIKARTSDWVEEWWSLLSPNLVWIGVCKFFSVFLTGSTYLLSLWFSVYNTPQLLIKVVLLYLFLLFFISTWSGLLITVIVSKPSMSLWQNSLPSYLCSWTYFISLCLFRNTSTTYPFQAWTKKKVMARRELHPSYGYKMWIDFG